MRDLAGIVISLLLAFAVWLIDAMSQKYTKVVTAEIVAESNISGHRNLSNTPQAITARVTTTGFNFLRIGRQQRKGPVKLFIDHNAFRPTVNGEFFWIRTADAAIASSADKIFGDKCRVESFDADTLQFRFPFENHKKVAVKPIETITFASQYMSVTGLEITPDSLVIYGEPSRLESIDCMYTMPIRLSKLSSPKKGHVKVAQLVGVRTSVEDVAYFIDVDRYAQVSREVTIGTVNVPKDVNFSVYPPKTTVDIRTVFPLLGASVPEIELVVDYNEYLSSISGKCVARVKGELPLGVFSVEPHTHVFDCISEIK